MPYKQLTQFFGSKPNTPLLAHSELLVLVTWCWPGAAGASDQVLGLSYWC